MPDSQRLRRARPLLGTVVDITVCGPQASVLSQALERGFAAVQRIGTLMSFHCAQSDVSRLNRDALQGPVTVAADTWRVLALAARVSEASGGRFDITVAPQLVARGYLPAPADAGKAPCKRASWRDLELLDGNRVRFHRPLWLDLGGIAKGYAVDLAVQGLRDAGVASGLVNAGGDLRCFGEQAWPVWLRNPGRGGAPLDLGTMKNCSLATSSGIGAAPVQGECGAAADANYGAHIDPAHARRSFEVASASVFAQDCVIADALTKVVMIRGQDAFAALRSFDARALAILRDGQAWVSDPELITGLQATTRARMQPAPSARRLQGSAA